MKQAKQSKQKKENRLGKPKEQDRKIKFITESYRGHKQPGTMFHCTQQNEKTSRSDYSVADYKLEWEVWLSAGNFGKCSLQITERL